MERFPEADVVIGGPPCQGFSPLNRNLVGFERRGLWREYLRALEQSDARAFVMENVPELLRSDEYAEFKRRAEKLGYRVEGEDPQRRRLRRAAAAPARDRDRHPRLRRSPGRSRRTPTPTACRSGGSRGGRFRDAVEGLPLKPDGEAWHVGRNPRPRASAATRPCRATAATASRCSATSTATGSATSCPPCWRNKPTGTTDVFGRLWWDRPAFTIRTEFYKPEKGRYLHPSAHRPITIREAARCMSFPDDFVLARPTSR